MKKFFLIMGLIQISLLLILVVPNKAKGYIGDSGIYAAGGAAAIGTKITEEESSLPNISFKIKSDFDFKICIFGDTTAPEGSSGRRADLFTISYKTSDGDYQVIYGSPPGVVEIIYPMGSIFKDGMWHTFVHNIDELIFEITGYHLESVNELIIQTNDIIRIDEIKVFSDTESKIIDNFSYQSSPIGIRWYYSNTSTALVSTVYDSSLDSQVLNLEYNSPALPPSSPEWEEFKSKYGGGSIRWDEVTNIPTSITGFMTPPSTDQPEKIAGDFLEDNHDLLRIDPSALVLYSITEVPLGMVRVVFVQDYQGISVKNSQVFVLMKTTGEIYYFNSNWYIPDLVIDITPSITPQEAAQIVKADLNTNKDIDSPELVIYQDIDDRDIYLAWEFSFSLGQEGSWIYHIDAQDGRIIRKFDALMYAVIPTNDDNSSNDNSSNDNSSSNPESDRYAQYLGYYGQSPFYGSPLYPGYTPWSSPLSYSPYTSFSGLEYNPGYQYTGNFQYPSWGNYYAPFDNFDYTSSYQPWGHNTFDPWSAYLGPNFPYSPSGPFQNYYGPLYSPYPYGPPTGYILSGTIPINYKWIDGYHPYIPGTYWEEDPSH